MTLVNMLAAGARGAMEGASRFAGFGSQPARSVFGRAVTDAKAETAVKTFSDMVAQNQQIIDKIPPERVLGFHRTTPDSAVELVRNQQFHGHRSGLHYGKNPMNNTSFGPAVLMVTARGPGRVAEEVFCSDNIRTTDFQKVRFDAYDYDHASEKIEDPDSRYYYGDVYD